MTLFFLATGMFTMGCSGFMLAGLLPGISSSLGVSLAAAAQGIAAFGLTYVIGAPVFSVLLARKPAKGILILALAVFLLGSLITLLATGLPTYLISRAIVGIGAGLYTPVAVAAAVQSGGAESRGRVLSFIWGANSAGAVIGVPLGLWLASGSGWQAAIGMTIGFALLSQIGIGVWLKDLRVNPVPSLAARVRLLGDRDVLSVIGVTCLTATGSLGLYSFAAASQAGAANPLASALFVWSAGGLIGSSTVGSVVDRTQRPRLVMAGILVLLIAAVALVPVVRSVAVFGLLPFFIWGAMGWATVTPQQHALIGLQPQQSGILAALNGSAVSMGSVLGAALGGGLLSRGFQPSNLPYAAAAFLFIPLIWQLILIRRSSGKGMA